jgi:hypothetical protein
MTPASCHQPPISAHLFEDPVPATETPLAVVLYVCLDRAPAPHCRRCRARLAGGGLDGRRVRSAGPERSPPTGHEESRLRRPDTAVPVSVQPDLTPTSDPAATG